MLIVASGTLESEGGGGGWWWWGRAGPPGGDRDRAAAGGGGAEGAAASALRVRGDVSRAHGARGVGGEAPRGEADAGGQFYVRNQIERWSELRSGSGTVTRGGGVEEPEENP